MKKAENLLETDPLKLLLTGMIQPRLNTGVRGEAILVLLQEIMEFVQDIIEPLEKSGQAPCIACSSGCSYCCHSQVNIIPAEALLIFSFISRHFNTAEIDFLKDRIIDNDILTKGKTTRQRVNIKDKTPCVFLKKHTCSIYSVRPFICRSWNSLDKAACKSAFFSSNHNAEIEASPVRNYIFSTARDVFRDLNHKIFLETDMQDVPHAILSCFNSPDALTHWAGGDHIFSPQSRD